MKLKFYLTSLCSIWTFCVSAQFVSIPHTTYIHTPYGQVPITTSTYMHIPYYFGTPGFKSPEMYSFKVTLKNDSILHFKSIMDFSENKHFLALTENKKYDLYYKPEKNKILRKIYPQDTKEIEAEFDDYGYIGIPYDSCWLFRTNDDLVYTYAMVPEDGDWYVTFFKKRGDYPVLPITKENVLDLVKDDEELKSKVKNDKKIKLYKIIKQYNKKYTP